MHLLHTLPAHILAKSFTDAKANCALFWGSSFLVQLRVLHLPRDQNALASARQAFYSVLKVKISFFLPSVCPA